MDCREYNIPVLEVPIQTVYLEGNASTHFHPVRDSIRIYAIFGKFLATSLSSSVIDIVLFTVFSGILQWLHLGHVILAATVGARVVSSIYNFLMNKGVVFRCEGKIQTTFFKYYALCIVQMLCSAGLVALFVKLLGIHATIVKIVVDTLLFLSAFGFRRNGYLKNDDIYCDWNCGLSGRPVYESGGQTVAGGSAPLAVFCGADALCGRYGGASFSWAVFGCRRGQRSGLSLFSHPGKTYLS